MRIRLKTIDADTLITVVICWRNARFKLHFSFVPSPKQIIEALEMEGPMPILKELVLENRYEVLRDHNFVFIPKVK